MIEKIKKNKTLIISVIAVCLLLILILTTTINNVIESKNKQNEAMEQNFIKKLSMALSNYNYYQMEKPIQLNPNNYTVVERTWSKKLNSNILLDKAAKNYYLFVKVAIWNKGNEKIIAPKFYLIDENNNIFPSSKESWRHNSFNDNEIEPDTSKEVFGIFDVPTGDNYRLIIIDNQTDYSSPEFKSGAIIYLKN